MDVDLFFPVSGYRLKVHPKAIDACSRCRVREQCGAAAAAAGEVGYWAGLLRRHHDRNNQAVARAS